MSIDKSSKMAYKIGGKKYTDKDISAYKAKESINTQTSRQIHKKSSLIKTNIDRNALIGSRKSVSAYKIKPVAKVKPPKKVLTAQNVPLTRITAHYSIQDTNTIRSRADNIKTGKTNRLNTETTKKDVQPEDIQKLERRLPINRSSTKNRLLYTIKPSDNQSPATFYKKEIQTMVTNNLETQGDSGTATVATAIATADNAGKVFQTAQDVSPYAINAVKRTGKGVVIIGKASYKIGRTGYKITSGEIPLNKETLTQVKVSTQSYVANTKVVKNITNTAQWVKSTGQTAKGIVDGRVKIYVTKEDVKYIGKAVGSKAFSAGKWTVKTTGKVAAKGAIGVGNMALSQEDLGIQSVGTGIKSIETLAKTTPTIVKGIKTSVNTPIKTVKTIKKATSYVKNNGVKKAAATAGKGVVTAATNAIKQSLRVVGTKIIVPVLIICLSTAAALSLINAPILAIGGLLSASFTMNNVDLDMHEYLIEVIPDYKNEFIQGIMNLSNENLVENGGNFHYIRLFTNVTESVLHDTIDGQLDPSTLYNVLYSDYEIANIIQPIFNIILLTEYNLEPTPEDVKNTINEIWDTLFRVVVEELPIEYCREHRDGCGSYHANISTCPNRLVGQHRGLEWCDSCCWWFDEQHICDGYNYCLGHHILSITINMDGIYELLAKYFTDPIDVLSNLQTRTPDQEKELLELKENYELCLVFLEEVQRNYGGGLNMNDLSGVNFINGSREGSQLIVDIALSQVGQAGGHPYWSWYGFSSRVEWCACFVSWCANQAGYLNSEIPKYAACVDGVQWYRNRSQWAAGGFTDLCPGDIIFFDWNGDGRANHTGIVIGTDGNFVYTVEGNSGDVCRVMSYPLNTTVILGYGIPNY